MPSNAKITPPIYTGPLTTSIGDDVTEFEGRSLFHAARVMLGRAISAADAVGLQTISSWYTFENGVTVRVARLGGQHIAEFVRHPVDALPSPEAYDAFMLSPYGGVIVDGYIIEEPITEDANGPQIRLLDRFSPSANTLTRLATVRKELEDALASVIDPAQAQELRSRIKYLHGKDDYGLKSVPYLPLSVPEQWSATYNNPVVSLTGPPPKVYSQYRLIKPTMFSGRMRIVVQLLMGMGRQEPPTKEQQLIFRGLDDTDRVAVEYYNNDPRGSLSSDDAMLGSIDYWYHWNKTEGVYTTDGGRYYLISISAAGVWAMRLSVLAMSNWVLPDSAKEYLDDLPLGYSFPTTTPTEAGRPSPWDQAVSEGWVKRIITADDMAQFYGELSSTYTECGWAFSMSGKRANNVGWKLNGPRPYDYPVFEHWSIEISGGDGGGTTEVYDYDHQTGGFDASIVDLRASIHRVERGNAVDTTRSTGPFKVPVIDPETGIPGVISFNMLPAGWPETGVVPMDYQRAASTYPVSDTTVHVFYDGEELVWIRFYNPMNTTKTETDSWTDVENSPYDLLLGAFTWGSYTRPLTLPKGFYSSKADPRKKADMSSVDMRSEGRKTWESPYMGVEYSWPYPPFHFGYEQSNDENSWYNEFNPSYTSRPGSPWTAKRHCFHVHVQGTHVSGQSYAYACTIPMTDREAAFICEMHVAETRSTVDYQYAAMVMQWVYNTFPIPGGLDWWMQRDDTVKGLAWGFFSNELNYTKEILQPAQTVLNIAAGTFEAPLNTWNYSKPEAAVENYEITTVCSTQTGEYPQKMKADKGASVLWVDKIPQEGGYQIAHFWCTRSVLGEESSKMHVYLNGMMAYAGLRADKLLATDKASPHRQVTFIGET
jgi:hypothetical protein